MKPKGKDVVAFTIEAMREALQQLYKGCLPDALTDEFFLDLDDRVRRVYGNSNDYIQKTSERDRLKKDQAIKEFAKGAPVAEASSRNGISRASLYRALNRKTGGV